MGSLMQKDTPLPANTSCDTSALDKVMKLGTDVVQVDGASTIVLEKWSDFARYATSRSTKC